MIEGKTALYVAITRINRVQIKGISYETKN